MYFFFNNVMTEDWSEYAENSALHHRNKINLKLIKIETKIKRTFQNINVSLFFDQINP